jgi:hypothetical protein
LRQHAKRFVERDEHCAKIFSRKRTQRTQIKGSLSWRLGVLAVKFIA